MRPGVERAVGIALGIVLGIAIVVAFVFLGSRDTIDDPSINQGGTTIEVPATTPQGQPQAPPEPLPGEP